MHTNRRRSVAIEIKDGKVRVLAPRSCSEKELASILADKRQWIEKKLAEDKARPRAVKKDYVHGEGFLFQGERLALQFSSLADEIKAHPPLFLAVPLRFKNSPALPAIMEGWYKREALAFFEERSQYYAGLLGVPPYRVAIKDYAHQWGCCMGDGRVFYNWRVIMAPRFVADYICLHEMAHLKEMNHSPKFWGIVGGLMPEYKNAKKWLNENGGLLQL